jgi:HSP20 family protein
LEGKSLTIRGERVPDPVREGEHYHRIERVYGPFERAFTLGGPVDEANVRATYRHGVLEICLPRAEESRPRQIPVTVG